MNRTTQLITGAALALLALTAQAQERRLDWEVTSIQASGKAKTQTFGTHSEVDYALHALCNMPAAMNPPDRFEITVRPLNAKPDDKRMRQASVTCAELRADPKAFSKKIPPPPPPKPGEAQPLIQLWD